MCELKVTKMLIWGEVPLVMLVIGTLGGRLRGTEARRHEGTKVRD